MWHGHPTCHVNVIKLKWEIIWTGRLPHLSELPHLPGVPHLHVKRPLEFIFAFLDIFVNQHVTSMLLFSSIYIERSPKLSWGIQRICRPFVLKTYYHYESLCVSRDSLSCDTRSLDLCFLFKYIFICIWYIPPHSYTFHTFCFTPIFSYVYYHAEYFSYPWKCCWLAKARNLIFILNFSSQRPYFNYIPLSNVYCGRQEEPVNLIFRFLLRMRRMYVASIRLDFH